VSAAGVGQGSLPVLGGHGRVGSTRLGSTWGDPPGTPRAMGMETEEQRAQATNLPH
jgi:hypothetical protein